MFPSVLAQRRALKDTASHTLTVELRTSLFGIRTMKQQQQQKPAVRQNRKRSFIVSELERNV